MVKSGGDIPGLCFLINDLKTTAYRGLGDAIMARITQDGFTAQGENHTQTETISADGQTRIDVPSSDFTTGADMVRSGQNLELHGQGGETIVIEGYFSADVPPAIHAPDGSALTPQLVESFARSPQQYAENETATDASPIGAAQEVKGDAFVIHADGTKEKLSIGTPVFEGDIIETSKEGAVNIVFMDETSLAVSQNARIALDGYTFDAATESGTTDLSVLRGVFVFTSGLIGRDDPDDVKIETPVGSIGIRGTIIAGHIVPDGESEISVIEGAIVIQNSVGEIILSQQYEMVKISAFDKPMENMGVMNAQDMNDKFGSVSDVIPTLFSTIEDSSKDTKDFTVDDAANADAPAEDAPLEAEASDSEDIAPVEDAPADTLPSVDMQDMMMQETVTGESLLTVRTDTNILSNTLATSTNIKPADIERERFVLKPPGEQIINPIVLQNTGTGASTPTLNLNSATAAQGVTKINDNIGNKIGYSVSSAGDVNNDGYDDVRFTNNTDATGQNHSYLVMGSASALGGFTTIAIPDATDDNSQSVITGIGDFDGDNIEDYLVGQPSNNGGSAYIISGANPSNFIELTNGGSGTSVASVGDINHDGKNDVLIGAPGVDKAYLIYGSNTFGTPIDVSTMTGQGFRINGATGGDFGKIVAGIGDIDGDGKMDFAIGDPLDGVSDFGAVHIHLGNSTATAAVSLSGDYAGHMLGNGIESAGDFNGDGRSDVIFAGETANTNGEYTLKIATHNGSGFQQKTILTSTQDILGGGGIGDWNGDGFDDFGVALQNGTNTDIYVVYGRSGVIPEYTLTDLQAPANAFKMTYTGISAGDDVEISAAGDVNGDGYADMVIGLSEADGGNGLVMVVNGRDNAQSGESVVGNNQNNVLSDNGGSVKSMIGGAGNDTFDISTINFRNIDGGHGTDRIRINSAGSLDFTNVNFERISGIENIAFNNPILTTATITLTAENIFNLLQTSDIGELKLEKSGSGNANLIFDDLTGADPADSTSSVAALLGGTYSGQSGGFDVYEIGANKLYIESTVTVSVV